MVEVESKAASLRIVGVSKSYGPTQVLSDITFDILEGRVHGLVGENGAGKSTLVKIITGVAPADSGEIWIGSRITQFRTPSDARVAGVSAVYQDPKLFPHLDVAENIFMGNYPLTPFGAVDSKLMYERAGGALRQLGLDLNPRSLVAGLSMAELQFVEVARALSTEVQLLILDEPTSALTPAESSKLFEIVGKLRERNKSVLFITHRLEEVEAICDDITVLRDGRHVATRPAREIDRTALVQMMVGRPASSLFAKRASARVGAEVLRVERLGLRGSFADISFSLCCGEIVGMAGLVGAGRSEIAQALFGMTPPTAGRVWLQGKVVTPRSPQQMLRLGLAYLPEDRDAQGLIMRETIVENVTLPIVERLARLGVLSLARERLIASEAVDAYQVKATSIYQVVSALSGGNRQKVAFAKWLGDQARRADPRRTHPWRRHWQQGANPQDHRRTRRHRARRAPHIF